MDGHAWTDGYRRRLDEIAARAARARAELETVEATASSRDGAVTVTVGAGGALRRLVLTERAEALGREQLAAAVLAAATEAGEQARRRVGEISAASAPAAEPSR